MLLLTLTEPNSSWDDFGRAIGRLQKAIAKLMRYKRVVAAVKHSFRALEVTCPRPGQFHPHFHVLLVVPAAYLEPDSPLYITQEEWARMWRKALGADGKRIIDIRVTENAGEVAKYVTKPSGYLELTGKCPENRYLRRHIQEIKPRWSAPRRRSQTLASREDADTGQVG